MNLPCNDKKEGKCVNTCSNISLKCVEKHKNSEIVDIISCLFPIGRVGTYRPVLHLLIKTITVCRKLKTKYMAINNMGTSILFRLGWLA